MEDSPFTDIVEDIRTALLIPNYEVVDFRGYGHPRGFTQKYLKRSTPSPTGEDTVKGDWVVPLTNWKNLSLLRTIYLSKQLISHANLDLSPQGYKNAYKLFPYMNKKNWRKEGYYLFIPRDAKVNEGDWRSQGIYYSNQYFAILKLNKNHKKFQVWWIQTPREIEPPVNGIQWPFTRMDWRDVTSVEGGSVDFHEWRGGTGWTVEGGGFYLGKEAEILLNYSESSLLGMLNWWAGF